MMNQTKSSYPILPDSFDLKDRPAWASAHSCKCTRKHCTAGDHQPLMDRRHISILMCQHYFHRCCTLVCHCHCYMRSGEEGMLVVCSNAHATECICTMLHSNAKGTTRYRQPAFYALARTQMTHKMAKQTEVVGCNREAGNKAGCQGWELTCWNTRSTIL